MGGKNHEKLVVYSAIPTLMGTASNVGISHAACGSTLKKPSLLQMHRHSFVDNGCGNVLSRKWSYWTKPHVSGISLYIALTFIETYGR